MNIFSVDLTVAEIQLARQSLDVISISGKDAKLVATLQIKLETELTQIQNMITQAETKKSATLQKVLEADKKIK
jgi:hypothetical protein